VEFDAARNALMKAGQDFLPGFEDFSSKDGMLDRKAFIDGLRHLFEVLGPQPFHGALEAQLKVLVSSPDNAVSSSQKIVACFRAWDVDGTGVITRGQLRNLLKAVGDSFSDADIDALMDVVDTNRNGIVEYVEFVNWLHADSGSSLEKIAKTRPSVVVASSKARARSPPAVPMVGAKSRARSPPRSKAKAKAR